MEVVNNFRQMNSYRFERLFIFADIKCDMKLEFVTYENRLAGNGIKAPKRFGHAFLRELSYYIGFLLQFFPSLILSRVTQNKGKQQSNLFLVSAGSDLRMSPLRPNPLSIRVDERRSKNVRDFLLLFSRTN